MLKVLLFGVLVTASNYGIYLFSPKPWQISGNGISPIVILLLSSSVCFTFLFIVNFIKQFEEIISRLWFIHKILVDIISIPLSIYLIYIGRLRFTILYDSLQYKWLQYVIPLYFRVFEVWLGCVLLLIAIICTLKTNQYAAKNKISEQ